MKLTKLQAKTKNKYYVVYKISNSQTKKHYIGCHKIKYGKEDDGYICSSKFVLALIYKDPKLFSKTILARYSTAKEADRAEKRFIKKYNSFEKGYNRSKDGGHYTAYGSYHNRRMRNYRRKRK